MIGIIGGSGLYEFIADITGKKTELMHTPHGVVDYTTGTWMGQDIVFIPRHGPGHDLPPHRVRHKANIWTMRELGVRRLAGTCAVGTLNERMPPGRITVPDQLLDLTKETRSFHNGRREGVKHVDMAEPFCPVMRAVVREVAVETGMTLQIGATYACFSGPTFETAAEIRMVKVLGGDLVGMTLAPEAKLSREAGICYLPVCMPVNWAAGLTKDPLSHRQTLERVGLMKNEMVNVIRWSMGKLPAERDCPCAREY